MTLLDAVNSTVANALFENAVFLTVNFSPSIVGRDSAPSASAAWSFAAIRGASPLPENELESTSRLAPILLTASAIMLA
ncbi:hypothetical protein D3C81_1524000 [compost metagenome]